MSDRIRRRDFLKVLGVTGAGAAALGCAAEPASQLIPYLVQPDEIVPGIPTIYASVCRECPAGCGLHARTREGRAIKLEGNPRHPVNAGKLCARGEAGLQGLYHPDRLRGPMRRDESGAFQPIPWDEAESLFVEKVAAAVGTGRIAYLGGPEEGTFGRLVDAWLAAVGGRARVAYDPYAPDALREAGRLAFGVSEVPDYALDEADLVVAFGADFLETWITPVEHARRFGARHSFRRRDISKLVFAHPRLSLSAANADEWVPVRPGSEMFLALAMARAILESGLARVPGGELGDVLGPFSPALAEERTGVPAETIVRLAREFAETRASVALPGGVADAHRSATESAVAVHLLNYVAGNIGKTVRFGVGPTRRATPFREVRALEGALAAGEIDVLLVHGSNPAYVLPGAMGFGAALEKAAFVVSFASVMDETAARAHLLLPDHHALESWGDHPARPGVVGLQQPVMRPVFDTRATGDVLLAAAKKLGPAMAAAFPAADFHAYLREAWREFARTHDPRRPFEELWAAALRDGGAFTEARPASVQLSPRVRGVRFEPPELDGQPDGTLALVAYPHPYWYDGRGALAPWLQELPDPMTRITWTAWAEIHPTTALRLGVRDGDLLRLTSDAGAIELPAYLHRGIREDTIAVPIGQGHTHGGRYAAGRSASPLALLPNAVDRLSGARAYLSTRVHAAPTGGHQPLPRVQSADEDHGREIAELLGVAAAREAETHAADEIRANPDAFVDAAEDADPKSPYRWGMVIDLSSCIGCHACVVACSAENNVPVVGEAQTLRRREMHWIRIDRYYEPGDNGAFQTTHVPILCQHCGNAPCEPVCPVFATYHSPEGLNAQVYNRCVGTRYCSNNCPYKVRRFNWLQVQAPGRPERELAFEGFPYPLNLQLNPDVTVRDKGVMEKCTFCVQRIALAKNDAVREGRLVRDGEIVPACARTCPTEAIVFGNLRDPASRVSRLARSGRAYHVLGELNTRPAITYLKEVTHNEAVARAAEARGHGHAAAPARGEGTV